MEHPLTFGACLRQVLEAHGLSASKLAVQMGFSSRNSLSRLLNDEVGYHRQRAFWDNFRTGNYIALTPQEEAQLLRCLEISRVGLATYQCNCAMDKLLCCEPYEPREWYAVIHHADGSAQRYAWQELLSQILQAAKVELMICNFGFGAFFETLEQTIVRQHAGDRVTISHIFTAQGFELAQTIAAIRPILYRPGYQGYLVPENMPAESRALLGVHLLCARTYDADGAQRYYHLMLSDHCRMDGFLCDPAETQDQRRSFAMDLYRRFMLQPIKASFDLPGSPQDYLYYTEQYRQLEADCRLYTIKRDVPINFIHPDLLLGSVTDGFRDSGFAGADGLSELIDQFYAIHLKRWNNFFESHKITHTIFTYEDMRRFALTGLQSDHFFAMRAYTPAERAAILTHLKEQTIVNPYFNIYFFKRDQLTLRDEIGLYEGKGVLFTKADTSYNLSGDHGETLLCQKSFCEQFKEHFLHKLLIHDVTDAQETLRLMDELIALCR